MMCSPSLGATAQASDGGTQKLVISLMEEHSVSIVALSAYMEAMIPSQLPVTAKSAYNTHSPVGLFHYRNVF